jgi:hypothetical protein
MGQQTLGGDDLTPLRETYLHRVTEALPKQAAEAGDWPIQRDHCFARVVLDFCLEGLGTTTLTGLPRTSGYRPMNYGRQSRSPTTCSKKVNPPWKR